MHKYGYLVGGILFLALSRNGVAAPVAEVMIPVTSGSSVNEVVIARAVSDPSPAPADLSRKECMAVSIYEEIWDADRLVTLPSVQVTFSYTFSEQYPLMVCGLLPQNTA